MRSLIQFEWLPFRKKWTFCLSMVIFFALGLFTAKGANFPFADVHRNSPYITSYIIALFSQISILSVIILSAQVLLREQDANFQQVLYSTPVEKNKLLMSRFFFIAMVASLLFLLFVLGLMAGHIIPWTSKDEQGPFNAWYYIQPFLLYALPNTMLCTAVICLMGWMSKNKLMIYLSGLLVYVVYIIVAIFSNSPLMATASPVSDAAMANAARIDPFGLAALYEQTKYWSAVERNTQLTALAGNLLFNRVMWMLVAVVFIFTGTRYYRFSVNSKKIIKRKAGKAEKEATSFHFKTVKADAGSAVHSLQTIFSFIKIDLKSIIKGIPFLLLCMLWIFLLGMEIYGSIEAGVRLPERYATTALMVNIILKTMPFFCLLAILFYSNELVWRSKNVHIDALENSTAVNRSMVFLSKLISLSAIPLALTFLSIITGNAFQVMYGYSHIDYILYGSLFYLLTLPMFLCLCIVMSIQLYFKNKYTGIVAATLFVLVTNSSIGKMIGFRNPLFRIGNSYEKLYSEMSGFAGYLVPFSWSIFYAAGLALAALLLAGNKWNKKSKWKMVAAGVAICMIIISAGYISYQDAFLHPRESKKERLQWQQDYEQLYRKYQHIPQPVVNTIQTQVALFPGEQRYEVKGMYLLQNKTQQPMDSFLLYFDRDCMEQWLEVSTATLIKKDERFGHYLYRFNKSLAPQDSFKIGFRFSYAWNGFKGHQPFNAIVQNGSFMRISNYFPVIGYQSGNEMEDEPTRKERHMGAASTLPEPGDETQPHHFIQLDMQLSTVAGQTAIGVGELIRQWETKGRNYFYYATTYPIPFRFGIASAHYAVQRSSYNGKSLEVYYHPSHAENVDSLIAGAKRTLAYCEKNFGPYPFNSIRFAEISSYTKGFAGTAYPAAIFMTEDMVFHTNIKKSRLVNVIGELTAHELAHQWWGGNMMQPANKKGRSVLTESLAMYTELMLNKQLADSATILNTVKMYKGFYFSEQGVRTENPLYKALPGETFLNYYKGLVAMYQLQLLLGEENVNFVLKKLLTRHTYPSSPASTTDLLNELYLTSNAAQKKYIDDLFRRVITHDIKIRTTSVKKLQDNNYVLGFDIDVSTYNAGIKTVANPGDSMEVAIYHDAGRDIVTLPVINNKVTGKIEVHYLPKKIEADPRMKLMDAFDEDNIKAL